ncbi:uncharacterized protein LOC134814470 [Bolinopsis microptera]|uniref:uncharacterized protein LOC134814470 n=1 Tax=Bolinopsis microptera TaxID=2820187 RepID=UPI003078A715
MPRVSFFSKPVIPGQLKYRLERMPLAMYKERGAHKQSSAYRLLKRSEVLGYTRGYTDSAKQSWRMALFRYKYAMKGEKIKRHVRRANLTQMNQTRTEAAAAEHGLSLLNLKLGLAKSDVQLNNKMLAELSIYEPKTFESLTEVAKQKLNDPGKGLECILRPDKPGIVHRTGLVPNHATFCTGLTKPEYAQEISEQVPRQSEIPPPHGWRITGQYPGKNLVRAERYHLNQRPKALDYKYLPTPLKEREEGGEVFPDNKQGKNFKYSWRKQLSDPKVYQKKPWLPVK